MQLQLTQKKNPDLYVNCCCYFTAHAGEMYSFKMSLAPIRATFIWTWFVKKNNNNFLLKPCPFPSVSTIVQCKSLLFGLFGLYFMVPLILTDPHDPCAPIWLCAVICPISDSKPHLSISWCRRSPSITFSSSSSYTSWDSRSTFLPLSTRFLSSAKEGSFILSPFLL